MSVITVSRQLGSFGTEIAQRVADKLNYEYLDKEKIEKALADYGLPAPVVERFVEKKPPSGTHGKSRGGNFFISSRP